MLDSHTLRRAAAMCLAAAALCAFAEARAETVAPTAAPSAAPTATLEARGKYLATAADCTSCHSSPGGAPFAGGAALKSQFGDFYGPNITPDDETGIGKWTEADFERALRHGIGKGGAPLYPAMPYNNYTKITDDDLHALWAYFRSLPPTHQKATPNALRFPFNLRQGVALWQAAFLSPGRYAPQASKDATWNRGAYLVEALGHCDACHTPRDLAGASDEKHHLGGAQVETWYAPDISGDALSKISQRSVDDLAMLLKTGHAPGNRKTFGPMQTVVHESLARLTDDDIRAIAIYLKDQPSAARPEATAVQRVPADRLEAGRLVYEQQCTTCHHDDGRGIKGKAPALVGSSGVTASAPLNVVVAVLGGFDPQGTWSAMPSFAGTLSDDEVADVANYVRHAWGNAGARAATASSVGTLRASVEMPPNGERAALSCPNLPNAEVAPALKPGATALRQSARDPAELQRLVRSYRAARPHASSADVIEAMSAAYCGAVAGAGASPERTGGLLASYSQQVAEALVGAPRTTR